LALQTKFWQPYNSFHLDGTIMLFDFLSLLDRERTERKFFNPKICFKPLFNYFYIPLTLRCQIQVHLKRYFFFCFFSNVNELFFILLKKNLIGNLINFDNTNLRNGDDFSHIWNLEQVHSAISEEIVLLIKPITILGNYYCQSKV